MKTPTKIYGPATDLARPAYLGRDDTTAVDTDELLHRIQAGDTVVIDEVGLRLAGLARDQKIVAYCRGQYCVLAHDAVRLLNSHGLSARRAADGGLEWRIAGRPVQAGAGLTLP